MALNDVYQLNVTHLLGTREISNVFYYVETVGGGTPPAQVAFDLSLEFYGSIWVPWWKRVISVDCQLTSIWARRMWPTEEKAGTVLFAGDFGSVAGDAVPNGAAVLVYMWAVNKIPRFRRLSYISGLSEAQQAGSRIVAAQVDDWQDLADALTATTLAPPSLFPATFQPGAYTKKFTAPPPAQPWELLAFNRLTLYLRSQRGRNPRQT